MLGFCFESPKPLWVFSSKVSRSILLYAEGLNLYMFVGLAPDHMLYPYALLADGAKEVDVY